MGVALVTKCVVSYYQRRIGNAVFVVHYTVKGIYPAVHYVLTRRSTLVLKVCVLGGL